ncbi:Serine/threonine-protein kinase, partial [Marasmius sp. AFHP31]
RELDACGSYRATSSILKLKYPNFHPPAVRTSEGIFRGLRSTEGEDRVITHLSTIFLLFFRTDVPIYWSPLLEYVEFNHNVDELNTLPQRPLRDRRAPSPSLDDFPDVDPLPVNIPSPNAPPNGLAPITFTSEYHELFGAMNSTGEARRQSSKSSLHEGSTPAQNGNTTNDPSSPQHPQIITLDPADRVNDPLEDKMLRELENLAQKTDVLMHWGYEMHEYIRANPSDPSKFTKREGEADKPRKRKNADMEVEYNAVTCVAVYMLFMSFSQEGVNILRNYQEHMQMRHLDGDFVVNEGFDDGSSFLYALCVMQWLTVDVMIFVALKWFKEHFIE